MTVEGQRYLEECRKVLKEEQMDAVSICLLYTSDFWAKDIRDVFIRIEILMRYKCLAYLMRYAAWEQAPEVYKGMYINLSRWCNQPAQYSKKSLREFCTGQGEYSSCFRYLTAFEALHPEMAHYLDMKYEEVQYGKDVYKRQSDSSNHVVPKGSKGL